MVVVCVCDPELLSTTDHSRPQWYPDSTYSTTLLYKLYSTSFTLQAVLYKLYSTSFTLQALLYKLYCLLYKVQALFILYKLYSTRYKLYSTLHVRLHTDLTPTHGGIGSETSNFTGFKSYLYGALTRPVTYETCHDLPSMYLGLYAVLR